MKKLKSMAALLLVGIVVFAFASCGQVVPSTYLEINPATGKGKASFTMSVPKNGVEGVGNNFAVYDDAGANVNQGYIVSAQKLLDLLKKSVPSGFTVTMKEQTNMIVKEGEDEETDIGSFDYTVTFSFNSIDDYNSKVNSWLPAKYWDAAKAALAVDEIKPVTMTSTGPDNAKEFTVTTDMRIIDVMCQWVFELVSTDKSGAVIDGGNGFQYEYLYNMDKGSYTLKLNGKETAKQYSNTKPEISAKATVDTTAVQPDESPATGSTVAVSAIIAAALAAGALVVAKKRK